MGLFVFSKKTSPFQLLPDSAAVPYCMIKENEKNRTWHKSLASTGI
jgi:hypothetical protein